MRYHFSPVNEKARDLTTQSLLRLWGNRNSNVVSESTERYNLYGRKSGNIYIALVFNPAIHLWDLSYGFTCTCSKWHMNRVIHYDVAYDNKSLETTQMPLRRKVVTWTMILLCTQWNTLSCKKGMRKDSMHWNGEIFKLYCFNEENKMENSVYHMLSFM